LRIDPAWVPALAAGKSAPGPDAMPALKTLTEGLDAMLD
jgi:hypothetical protein